MPWFFVLPTPEGTTHEWIASVDITEEDRLRIQVYNGEPARGADLLTTVELCVREIAPLGESRQLGIYLCPPSQLPELLASGAANTTDPDHPGERNA